MKESEFVEISDKIDEILLKYDIEVSEAISVLSFAIAKILFAIGVADNRISEASEAIRRDIVRTYYNVDKIIDEYKHQSN